MLLFVDTLSRRLSVVKVCCLIFVLSFAMRLIVGLLRLKLYLQDAPIEVDKIAISLITTGVFGNPYSLPTGPTAHAAPIYPSMLALLYWVFGTGTLGGWARFIFNNFVTSLQYSLLPVIAITFGLHTRVGVLAGLIGALVPLYFWSEIWGFEAPFAGTALMILNLLTLRFWQQHDFSIRAAVVQGFCWGFGLLVAPNLILVFLGTMLSVFFFFPNNHKLVFYSAIIIFLMGVTLIPWTLRNYFQLGAVFFIRSNLGLELSISNNDLAKATMTDNFGTGWSVGHPNARRHEAMKVQQIGEVAYNKEKMKNALDWIRDNPFKFLRLTALRIVYFWFPKTDRLPQSILAGILTIAGGVGLWQLFRVNRLAAALVIMIWVGFPITFYFLQFSTRYRYPIHWTFLILAALALDNGVRSRSGARH
jgi:hypothetical protein